MSLKEGDKRSDPRMVIAFYDQHLDFCKEMARKQHLNVTQYVNSLIRKEIEETGWQLGENSFCCRTENNSCT